MRLICILFFLLPFYAFAQDCKLKRTTDPYTKETLLSTGLISLDGTSLSVQADSKEIDFFFSMSRKESCFSDASTAIINYEGTKVKGTFKNTGATNCEGFFHIIFKNNAATNSLLQKLITQKITSIVFTGNGATKTTVELSADEQLKVMTLADCLVKEAKTLVK